MAISITSPADAIVVEVYVDQNERVAARARLFRLEYLQEPLVLARLQSQLALLQSRNYEVTEEFISRQRQIIEQAIAVATAYQTYVQTALSRVRDARDPPTIVLRQYEAEDSEASARVVELRTNLYTFNNDAEFRQVEQTQQVNLVQSEIRVLVDFLQRDTVHSPFAGTVELRSGGSLFVKRGQELAVVNLG